MPTFATLTAVDQISISGGASHDIKFQPSSGQISIQSAPATPPKSLTQLSELAPFGHVELLRPGETTPIATTSATVLSPSLELSYLATAADTKASGDWICRVINNTTLNIDFATDVTYVSTIPLRTASFDVDLLKALLSAVVGTAALQVHLESNDDPAKKLSVASWSVVVANLIGGSIEWRENINDFSETVEYVRNAKFRLFNLNSELTNITVLTNPLRILLTVFFNTDNAILHTISLGVPDVKISSFQIGLTIGFDGTIVPECDVTAIANVGQDTLDKSDDVKKKVEERVNSNIHSAGLIPGTVRKYIDSFFIRLLRLSEPLNAVRVNQAHVQEYTFDGDSLIVSYYLTLEPVVLTNRL